MTAPVWTESTRSTGVLFCRFDDLWDGCIAGPRDGIVRPGDTVFWEVFVLGGHRRSLSGRASTLDEAKSAALAAWRSTGGAS